MSAEILMHDTSSHTVIQTCIIAVSHQGGTDALDCASVLPRVFLCSGQKQESRLEVEITSK